MYEQQIHRSVEPNTLQTQALSNSTHTYTLKLCLNWCVLTALCYLCFQGKESAEVEPWEEANFDLYKAVDRFGFLQ